MNTVGQFPAELLARRQLSPRVQALTFRACSQRALYWAAGQYVELSVSNALRSHAYSIASTMSARHPCEFELAVVTASSADFVRNLEVGGRLDVRGPLGAFTLQTAASVPTLFVGVGTGIAPLRAMLSETLARSDPHPSVVLFGCRSESEILWAKEFRDLARRDERLRFEPTLSQPGPAWTGRRGYVQTHLRELTRKLPDAHT